MAVNINNAFVGAPPIDGGVYFNAPLGTKLPTSATEKLDEACLLYTSPSPRDS